ncbi:hypothetical protein NDU88_000674 [Pleurodeles waltl]|uniref:Uncharacterized protein n=1 Tax=Pleurodeles waltl TaxID=8319 RepID=A0AAV7L7B5_PLEWA|nr:hypothetical protein NDU88_000674 [Pleurodeles waltl]
MTRKQHCEPPLSCRASSAEHCRHPHLRLCPAGVPWTGQAPLKHCQPTRPRPHPCLCPTGGAVDGADRVQSGEEVRQGH